MKRTLSLATLTLIAVLIFAPILVVGKENENVNTQQLTNISSEEKAKDIYETAIKNMQCEMEEINSIEDKQKWFICYKNIIEKYSETIDPPETIYDYYSEDELELLFRVVEAEATAGSFYEKANIASVIFNRINHEEFGDTLNDVLVKKQFSCISDGRYLKVEIMDDTILACEYAFMIEDTTNGALFFEKGTGVHAAYADYTFTDNIGHDFYVERKRN